MPVAIELEKSLFALPPEERFALGSRLLDSAEEELDDAWEPEDILAEAQRRDAELESGVEKPVSHENLVHNLRRSFPFLSER